MKFLNISAYRFVSLESSALPEFRVVLRERAVALSLKGTILLSTEGINLFLAGSQEAIHEFRECLNQYPEFKDLPVKESWSDHQPFNRTLVRLKKEIISMGRSEIVPEKMTAPYVEPETLKQWYDEGRDMVILDTRNDYEVELGTFENALDLNIETFRAFPDAVDMLPDDMKNKTLVTFCTGGIRCEKAAAFMLQKGFKNVYQLQGGILNYFEKYGGDHYQGECFVFDHRVAVDPALQETTTQQCFSCRGVLPLAKKPDDDICPHCQHSVYGKSGRPLAASAPLALD